MSAAVVTLSMTSFGVASDVTDATRKFRGEYYDVQRSATYQRHAQDYSRMIYQTQQVQPAVPVAGVQEHATAVRQNTVKAKDTLQGAKTAHAKDPEIAKMIASIEKHYQNVLTHCDMLDECCKSKDGMAKIGDCCVDIHEELEAAKAETDKLMKHLKIEPLGMPKKSAAKK